MWISTVEIRDAATYNARHCNHTTNPGSIGSRRKITEVEIRCNAIYYIRCNYGHFQRKPLAALADSGAPSFFYGVFFDLHGITEHVSVETAEEAMRGEMKNSLPQAVNQALHEAHCRGVLRN